MSQFFNYMERHILPNFRPDGPHTEGDLVKYGPFYGIAYKDVTYTTDPTPLYVDVLTPVRKLSNAALAAGVAVAPISAPTTDTTSLAVAAATTGGTIIGYVIEAAAQTAKKVNIRLLLPPYHQLGRSAGGEG